MYKPNKTNRNQLKKYYFLQRLQNELEVQFQLTQRAPESSQSKATLSILERAEKDLIQHYDSVIKSLKQLNSGNFSRYENENALMKAKEVNAKEERPVKAGVQIQSVGIAKVGEFFFP